MAGDRQVGEDLRRGGGLEIHDVEAVRIVDRVGDTVLQRHVVGDAGLPPAAEKRRGGWSLQPEDGQAAAGGGDVGPIALEADAQGVAAGLGLEELHRHIRIGDIERRHRSVGVGDVDEIVPEREPVRSFRTVIKTPRRRVHRIRQIEDQEPAGIPDRLLAARPEGVEESFRRLQGVGRIRHGVDRGDEEGVLGIGDVDDAEAVEPVRAVGMAPPDREGEAGSHRVAAAEASRLIGVRQVEDLDPAIVSGGDVEEIADDFEIAGGARHRMHAEKHRMRGGREVVDEEPVGRRSDVGTVADDLDRGRTAGRIEAGEPLQQDRLGRVGDIERRHASREEHDGDILDDPDRLGSAPEGRGDVHGVLGVSRRGRRAGEEDDDEDERENESPGPRGRGRMPSTLRINTARGGPVMVCHGGLLVGAWKRPRQGYARWERRATRASPSGVPDNPVYRTIATCRERVPAADVSFRK